jgi:hypothetical protein
MRLGRRIAIAITGGVVVLVGAILSLPLVPGPGVAVIILGLGILSLEFERPRVWLAYLKARAVELKRKVGEKVRSARSRDG